MSQCDDRASFGNKEMILFQANANARSAREERRSQTTTDQKIAWGGGGESEVTFFLVKAQAKTRELSMLRKTDAPGFMRPRKEKKAEDSGIPF